ncbi:MAG: contractile injection system protein, VgrG/Pvc8 family [Candidatus Sedimenticola endophacoides]
MTPAFRILADSQDITDRIRDRLLSLRVTDEAGIKSDTVEIKLDDRDALVVWPEHGAELEVSLGYQQSGLTRLGLYIVDEVEHGGPPYALTIWAKASDMRQSLKAPRTRVWDNVTLADMVTTIAGEHGLVPKISEPLAAVSYTHLDQTEESDLHLLNWLARENSAVTKPVAGNLIFATRGESKSISGKDLPTVQIVGSQIQRHQMTQADRSKYAAVLTHWHDSMKAERVPVKAGQGKPVYTLRHTYPDSEQATRAAQAKLEALKRGTGTLSLTLIGNSDLMTEAKLELKGIRDRVDGEWLIQRVEHQFDNQGFVTEL